MGYSDRLIISNIILKIIIIFKRKARTGIKEPHCLNCIGCSQVYNLNDYKLKGLPTVVSANDGPLQLKVLVSKFFMFRVYSIV